MIVVVGGQARKVGKTRAICDIIRATPEARWVAIKVSPHEHEPPGRITDTDRYLSAGAAEAFIVRELPPLPAGRNVVIESNAARDAVKPDLFVFVADPANEEWKESAVRVASRADYVVNEFVTREVLDRISELLSSSRAGCPPCPPE
jgi:hypothetical protein